MAQSPTKGLSFVVNDRKIVFGALDNGDAEVVVLAVEKGKGSNDYSWEVQIFVELLQLTYKGDINAYMAYVVQETNEVLDLLFGKVDTPANDLEKVQAFISNKLAYDSVNNKIVLR
jgi:hypothetical protein